MSRFVNVRDNAGTESVFLSQKTERNRGNTYNNRNHACAYVFGDIKRLFNPKLRHSTIGYPSPVNLKERAMKA